MYKENRPVPTKPVIRLMAMLVVAILLAGPAAPHALAQPTARVSVLIAFTKQPGPAEQALVRGVGGEIKYTYHLVPAIAARVPESALDELRRNPNITAVEPDLEVQVVDAELDNTWGVKHIGAGTVHASGNGGAGIKVGILDTGIDTTHPDLNYDPTCSASFVTGETLMDGNSHGTHVAGTVAALDNDTGVIGMAPQATLCIYKVLNNSGNGNYSNIIAALERAVADGVQVTNNSYGGSADPGLTVRAAFDNAYATGVLHVAAAGNNGTPDGTGDNCIYPARWDSVIATAATTPSDTRASFSSTCSEVELAAPGDQINSTLPGGGDGLKSGTSMASPHVAGSVALVLAANPGWSNDQVRLQLQITAVDLGDPGRDAQYGYGLVNAQAATGVTNHSPLANDQAVMSAEDTTRAITLTGNDPDGDALTFSVVSAPSHGSLSGVAPNLTYTPTLNFNGPDSFTFKTNDGTADSNIATVSLTVSPVNDPPLANSQSVTTSAGTPLAIILSGSDVDGDALTFSVVSGPSKGVLSGSAPNLTYTPNSGFRGADSFTFTSRDGQVTSVAATISITVTDKVTISSAIYNSRKAQLTVQATSSAGSGMTLTATAFDAGGNALGSVVMSYKSGKYQGTISGLATKPFRVVVTSSGGGSASLQGGAIGG